jgi:integrase
MRRMGMGKVRLRNGIHYLHWYAKGQERREAVWKLLGKRADQVTDAEARKCLKDRVAAKWTGTVLTRQDERVTVATLLAEYEAARLNEGIKRPARYKAELVLIRAWWGELIASQLDGPALHALVRAKLDAGFAPGTVRNRLTILHAALKLAGRRLPPLPLFPVITVPQTRRGRFTPEEVAALRGHLAPALADLVGFGSLTGWRISEVAGLTWARVDLKRSLLFLDDTKTDDPRVRPIEPLMAALLARRASARQLGCPLVFHVAGRAIPGSTFYLAWKRACTAAGLSGRFFHDLRRTAYHDLMRKGVNLFDSMDLIGHRSLTSARRYAMPSVERMRGALEQRDAAGAGQ